MRKIIATAVIAAVATFGLSGCYSDAEVASENVSKSADQFEIERRVVFFNGITDTYLLTIEGLCSIDDEGNQLEVICKVPSEVDSAGYKKHFLGLSDNVSYFVEQLRPANVSTTRYRVIFKPESIIPNIDRP